MRVQFSIDVIVPKIVELGMARLPYEACGVVVPDLDKTADLWVHEMANRSPDPLNNYRIDPGTVKSLLVDPEVWEDVLVWHTHPSGLVGPSKNDLKMKDARLKYIVVALPRGEAVMF